MSSSLSPGLPLILARTRRPTGGAVPGARLTLTSHLGDTGIGRTKHPTDSCGRSSDETTLRIREISEAVPRQTRRDTAPEWTQHYLPKFRQGSIVNEPD